MKVSIRKCPTDEDWSLVKELALATMGKKMVTLPTEEWKKSILKARHSPIRTLQFCFYLEDIPYWVSVHLCRHIHATPFVLSQRNDRQDKYDRTKAPQDAPVNMYWYMNAEELMVIANKRLCKQASKLTQHIVRMICDAVIAELPEFKDFLVSMCNYTGECKEMFPCYLNPHLGEKN